MIAPVVVPRLTLAQAGEALDQAVRTATDRMLAGLKQLPEPRMLGSDLRRRPIGFRSLGQLLAAAARDRAPMSSALAVAEAVHGFVLLLFQHDPTPVLESWLEETREQGEADLAQGAALCTRSLGDLDRAIEQTQEEIGAKRRLMYSLHVERHRAATALDGGAAAQNHRRPVPPLSSHSAVRA